MVFGRVAGKTAMEEFKSCPEGAADVQKNKTRDVAALRTKLQQLLRTKMGVIRTPEGLKQAMEEADLLLQQLQEHEDCYEAWRLYNDAVTAALALESALKRKNSLGCHEVR